MHESGSSTAEPHCVTDASMDASTDVSIGAKADASEAPVYIQTHPG